MTTMKVRLYLCEPIGICEVAGSADTKPVNPGFDYIYTLVSIPCGVAGVCRPTAKHMAYAIAG